MRPPSAHEKATLRGKSWRSRSERDLGNKLWREPREAHSESLPPRVGEDRRQQRCQLNLRAYAPGKGPLKILGRFSSDVILSGEMRRLQGYRNPLAAEGRYDRRLIS